MGTYAQFDPTHYPFGPDRLDEYCGTCRNTGVVMYPISVGVHREEADLCPFGCEIGETVVDEYGELHYLPVVEDDGRTVTWEEWQEDALRAWYRNGDVHQDPFYILSSHMKRRGIKPYTPPVMSKHVGAVSSDHPVMGLVEDGVRVYPCTVPPYLVGVPIEVTDTVTVVKYDYMGSSITVRFSKSEAAFLRFAYSWDDDFSTPQLLGS